MSKLLIDLAGYSYHSVQNLLSSFDELDLLVEQGALLCCDDQEGSIRKDNVPYYKAARGLVSWQQTQTRDEARAWARRAWDRYGVRPVKGLEGDDLLSLHFTLGDTCMTQDKDLLQLPGVKLVDFYSTEWDISRQQRKTKLNISTPARWLNYQLLTGDSTDGIPRIVYTGDRKVIPFIFKCERHFTATVELMPRRLLVNNINCAFLPTPLYTGTNPIDAVYDRYGNSV